MIRIAPPPLMPPVKMEGEPTKVVARLDKLSHSLPAICAIEVTSTEFVQVARAQRWDLVCYCATNAYDPMVQKQAIYTLVES